MMNSPLPVWVPDADVTACQICSQPFTTLTRKHHCRACGRVACDACSMKRRMLPATGDELVRVCDECDTRMTNTEASNTRSARTSLSEKPNIAAAAPVSSSSSSSSSSQHPVAAPAIPVTSSAATPARSKPTAMPIAAVATAPRLVPPTAAPVTGTTPPAASGGFFSSFASKLSQRVEAHAPNLVAAVREQLHVAAAKDAQEIEEKKAHERRILEDAGVIVVSETPTTGQASSVVATPSASVPASSAAQPPAAGGSLAIPGLGVVALAPPTSSSSSSKDKKRSAAESPSRPEVIMLPVTPSSASSMQQEKDLRKRRGGSHQKHASLDTPTSSSSSGAVDSSYKLDLPLRLCLIILKKTAGEMREKYAEYLTTKSRRQEEEPLTFAQFMFFSTIRTLPDFLFKKTELAYCMMRAEAETLVYFENFRRYAPILHPLASKLDAHLLYHVLETASLKSGVALTKEQIEEMEADEEAARIEGDTDPNSTPLIKRKAGGIGFPQFKVYVENLKKSTRDSELAWPDFRTFFGGSDAAMDKHEQLLLVRTGVTDTTTFPPRIGRLGFTTSHLLYESSFLNRKRCIRWNNIIRIETNEESFWKKVTGGSTDKNAAAAGATSDAVAASSSSSSTSSNMKGMKLFVIDDEISVDGHAAKREYNITLDIPGWSSETVLERQRTFEYIRILMHLHKLVAIIPDKVVSSALIQETCMTIQRMRALEAVGHGCDPLMLNPFPGYDLKAIPMGGKGSKLAPSPAASGFNAMPSPSSTSSLSSSSTALVEVSPSSTSDAVVPAASSSSSTFVSSIQASINRAESIRKSKSSWLFAILPGLQDKEQESLTEDIDPELASEQSYKTAEELLKLSQQHEQPFTLKNFAYNVKLFRYEIEPFMLFCSMLKRVRDWENPLVTLFTVMLLLNMSYRDLLQYLPALFLLVNIVIIAVLKYYPNAVWLGLGGKLSDADLAQMNYDANMNDASIRMEVVKEDNSSAGNNGDIGGGLVVVGANDSVGMTGFPQSTALTSPASSKTSGMPTAHPVPSSSSSSSSSTKQAHNESLLQKLKNYRDVAVRTKDYLHSVQNSIGEQNIRMMKIEGLYKWRTPVVTQKFFVMLCAGFVVMIFIPFRFLFPFIVLDFFTTKWQRQGTFERLMEAVELPARMPDVD